MIETIVSWFTALFAWIARLFEWFSGLFGDLLEFLLDFPLLILRGILDGVVYLLSLIPVPDFLTAYSLQSLFSGLPNEVLWFVDFFGIPQGLLLLGGGVSFRLLRKAITLGQW